MKKIFCFVLLLVSSLVFAAQNPSYLLVQSASGGTLVHEKGDQYTLTLRKVPHDVWFFTDRPERKSGTLKLEKFMGLWNSTSSNFKQDPPNAAIALMNGNSEKVGMIASLNKPEQKDDSVIYHLTKISKPDIPTGDFNQVILFIDNVQWGPGGL